MFVLGAWDAQQCFKARFCACNITIDVECGRDQMQAPVMCLHMPACASCTPCQGLDLYWFYKVAC